MWWCGQVSIHQILHLKGKKRGVSLLCIPVAQNSPKQPSSGDGAISHILGGMTPGALRSCPFGDRVTAGTSQRSWAGMAREDQTGRRKRSDGAQRKGIAGEEKPRMCGILFLAVALMPPRWRMFVSVPRVGEIRTSCEAPSAHPGTQRLPGGDSCLLPRNSCLLPQEKAEEAPPASPSRVLPTSLQIPKLRPHSAPPASTELFFNKVKISVSIWFLPLQVQHYSV